MEEKKPSLVRKAAQVGGWRLAKKVATSVPYLGSVMAVGLVGYDIKRKGLVGGVLNAGINAIPFVGTAKNAVELFRGDIFPDKPATRK